MSDRALRRQARALPVGPHAWMLVLAVGAGLFVADEHGRYVAVNQAACRLVGYDREELLGLRVTDLVPAYGRRGAVSDVTCEPCHASWSTWGSRRTVDRFPPREPPPKLGPSGKGKAGDQIAGPGVSRLPA